MDELDGGAEGERSAPFGHRGAILKKYRDAALVVDLVSHEDRQRELFFRRVPRRLGGNGYELGETIWRLEFKNEDVDNLIAFLRDEPTLSRGFAPPDMAPGGPMAALADLIDSEGIDTSSLVNAVTQRNDLGAVVAALAATDKGLPAAQGALIRRRRALVAELQRMAENPDTTETDLQRAMGDAYWLFGGRYIGTAPRNLAPLDQHDIPLLGADGTLHIVELKGPNIPNLVHRHRNHWIVGNDVHEATSQAMNYLRTLDEMGSALSTMYRDERGVDYNMRRLFATVVIGHPRHLRDKEADERVVEQTIRSYNAHLSRVEVITYFTLLEAAERALQFEDTALPGTTS